MKKLIWLVLSVVIVIADQTTKMLVIDNLTLYQRIPLLPVLDLVRLHNTGAAFSFLAGESGWQNWLFSGVALIVSGGILWWLVTLKEDGRRALQLGLALVLGGALGNVIDRVRDGSVIDFLDVYIGKYHWPAFNVADSGITVGVTIFLVLQLLEGDGETKEPVEDTV